MRACTVDGCGRRHDARGLCAMHRMRMVTNGKLELDPKPTDAERFWSKVDTSGECWIWTGAVTSRYGEFRLNGTMARAHRVAYELLIGPIPDGLDLDHRPTCPKHCVNPGHLRPVTAKQNGENRAGPTVRNTSGVRGVWLFKRTGRWVASVRHHGVNHHVGYFSTVEQAEAAVVAKRLELFTHNDLDRERAAS